MVDHGRSAAEHAPGVNLEDRVEALEQRVEALEAARPGRKRKPILVSSEGICGVEPAIDASTCPYASLYRSRQGCKGTRCQTLASEYYAEYRQRKNQEE